MITYRRAAVGFGSDLTVAVGARLLRGVALDPSLADHRSLWAEPRRVSATELIADATRAGLRGRGGAGFPFATKLSTALASGRRRHVIVNAAEGEPGSAKDSALLLTCPHLVLDGAELVAAALETSAVTVIVPAERPAVGIAVRAAVHERGTAGRVISGAGMSGRDMDVAFDVIDTGGTFVAGQARAVIERVEGRPNLPVTAWTPEAVSGVKGRPTLLSNAETFAQVAALSALGAAEYAEVGTPDEPGTTLVTVAGDGPNGVVVEVPLGTALAEILRYCGFAEDSPVIMGGYHGVWLPPAQVRHRRLSRADLASGGATPGAGVVLPVAPTLCPVAVTAGIVDYLASQSARRCGPCRNGLPALAAAVLEFAEGGGPDPSIRVKELMAVVTGRGACAHPDGTARLVGSLFRAFPEEIAAHEHRRCCLDPTAPRLEVATR